MLITLKGVDDPVEIGLTVPIGICSYPDASDNSVLEHKIHFFVYYSGAWAEISKKQYNLLSVAGNPPQNI